MMLGNKADNRYDDLIWLFSVHCAINVVVAFASKASPIETVHFDTESFFVVWMERYKSKHIPHPSSNSGGGNQRQILVSHGQQSSNIKTSRLLLLTT